ncbi:MAG: hypothetical protein MUC92_10275 [Fimbriimonadaceae bacterium]|nr:hypothetical protein [Fimbriimonadaceae bacterium]
MFAFPHASRGSLLVVLSLVGASSALASSPLTKGEALSDLIHPQFAQSLRRADKAFREDDYYLSLALLHGVVYPDGITLGFDETSLRGSKAKFTKATHRAMVIWQNAMDGDSPMVYAEPGAKPEITMVLVDTLPQGNDVMGLIQMEKKYQWNKRMFRLEQKITISILRSYEGHALTEDQMTEVIAHEMGHLLGLADVDEVGPLMGPMQIGKPSTDPLPREVQAVKQLRRVAREQILTVQRQIVATSERVAG